MNATRKNLTRLTVAGSSVALFAGLAVPAYACTQADPGRSVAAVVQPAQTLAGLQAKVDAFVTHRLAELTAQTARVSASMRMTAAQKAAAQVRISAESDALTALRATVDSETTVSAVQADLEAARLAALKTRVDARIDARLSALATASTRVQANATLTDPQKAKATSRIQAKVAALTALKAKVDAQTTTRAVLADLRAAGALWDRDGHDGKARDGKARNGNDRHGKAADPRSGAHGRVVVAGRGQAVAVRAVSTGSVTTAAVTTADAARLVIDTDICVVRTTQMSVSSVSLRGRGQPTAAMTSSETSKLAHTFWTSSLSSSASISRKTFGAASASSSTVTLGTNEASADS